MQLAMDSGNWSEAVQKRLMRCVALSALLLFLVLSLLHLPVPVLVTPSPRVIEITLPKPVEIRTELPRVEVSPVEITEVTEIVEEPATVPAKAAETVPAASNVPLVAPAMPVDWYAELERVVAELAGRVSEPNSVNPHWDELRRIARARYSKPKNDPFKPIWENVEKDYLGRTILRDGNCFRIIDDPSVGNRYVFENFQQFMVYCSYQASSGQELPWVKEIRVRYAYLRREKDPMPAVP